MSRASSRALGGLLIGIFTIGFSAILITLADAPGPVTVFYRVAIPSLLFAPLILGRWVSRRRRGVSQPGSRALAFGLLAGFFFGLDMASWATAVKLAGPTIPTLLANTAPVWVGLGALLVFRQGLKPLFWFGVLVTIGGVSTIAVQGLDGGGISLPAVGFGLLAGLLYGLFYLAAQKGREGLETPEFFWVFSTGAAIIILVVCLVAGYPILGYSGRTYGTFLLLALSAQVLGWMFINYAQGHLPASLVSPSMLGQPVVTAVFAGPLVGDALSRWDVVGGVVVLIGIYLVHRSHRSAVVSPEDS
jgi:drug/metabolite transporter (DMT)-like permease